MHPYHEKQAFIFHRINTQTEVKASWSYSSEIVYPTNKTPYAGIVRIRLKGSALPSQPNGTPGLFGNIVSHCRRFVKREKKDNKKRMMNNHDRNSVAISYHNYSSLLSHFINTPPRTGPRRSICRRGNLCLLPRPCPCSRRSNSLRSRSDPCSSRCIRRPRCTRRRTC